MPELQMSLRTWTGIIAILKNKKSARTVAWTRDNNGQLQERYATALYDVPDYAAKWLLTELDRREEWEWRPEPNELRTAVVKRYAPKEMSPGEAYQQLRELRRRRGLHARPDPRNPNWFLAGPPPGLPPLLERLIDEIGWQEWCESDTEASIERAQVERRFERISTDAKSRGEIVAMLPPAEIDERHLLTVQKEEKYLAIEGQEGDE